MKQIILTSLLVSLVIAGFSQKHVRLSFVGSPTVNWMNTSNSEAERKKSILGYDFGINGDFYFSEDERYSLLTGVEISNIGGEIAYRSNSDFQFAGKILPAQSKINYRLRYIEIPLAIRLKTEQFERVRYWGLFGFSTLLNIEAKGESSDGSLKKSNIGEEINPMNLAMSIGIGFDYDLSGSNSISTGLIFENGLIDVTTDNAFTDKTIINSLKLKIGLIF